MGTIENLVRRTVAARERAAPGRSALLAISGIDGSGKGYVAAHVAGTLQERGMRVATINVDGWLNLPAVRFAEVNPGRHFYHHALRLDDMFAQLVLPLRERRSVRVTTDFAEETATAFRPHTYEFADIDVVIVEGIFLLKRAFRAHYDLSCWIACSFETALERALARGQEGHPPRRDGARVPDHLLPRPGDPPGGRRPDRCRDADSRQRPRVATTHAGGLDSRRERGRRAR